jgi:hypothetical protein
MDYESPRFIASVKKILRQLAGETDEDKRAIKELPPPITHEVHVSDSTIDRIKIPTAHETRHEWWKDFMELAGIGVLTLYTMFAAFQWYELNTQNINQSVANISNGVTADRTLKDTHALAQAAVEQAKTMRDTLKFEEERFVSEQRPYIWFVSQKPTMQVGSRLTWSVVSENDGRSAALNMHSCVIALVRLTDDRTPLDERFKNDVPSPSFGKCQKRAKGENRGLAPPGGKTALTADGAVLSQDQIDYANKVFGTLIIEAISEYEDSRGNHYLTTFCDIYSPTGINVQCPYYNEVK